MDINEQFESMFSNQATHSMMAIFASTILASGPTAHMMHWTTRSFAQHMTLDTYYNEIPGLIDAVVETYQGKYGLIGSFPQSIATPASTDFMSYFNGLKNFLATTRTQLPADSELQNEIDNIATLIDSTIYKLTFLS
jgi:hypothetical protein